ncbi:MAG: phospholipase D family protein [Solirubrobacterales bacterium]
MPPLLRLQDPGAPSGLLEAILEACDGADRGGGIFSWTTAEGARFLLDADTFRTFADESAFKLVIGVDSITDPAALEAVRDRTAELSGLTARVLLHELRPVLFHPKLSWFVADGRLTLLVGSGNLTRGGLRTNWEAFTVVDLEGAEAAAVEAQIEAWLEAWDDSLLALDDPQVMARARQNSGRERSLKRPSRRRRGAEDRGGEGAEPTRGEEDVLVAAIGGGRGWSQANFPRRFYEGLRSPAFASASCSRCAGSTSTSRSGSSTSAAPTRTASSARRSRGGCEACR